MLIRRFANLVLVVAVWLFPHTGHCEDVPLIKPPAASCLQFAEDAGMASEAVGALKFAVGETTQPLAEVRLGGLTTLTLEAVWQLVGGGATGPLDVEQAAALIGRLAQSGLFASVKPTVRLSPEGTGAVIEIVVVENPTVRAIDVRGLAEVTRDEILDALLVVPAADEAETDEDVLRVGHLTRARNALVALRCSAPIPPKAWLARHAHGELQPGLVWRGLRRGVERVQQFLRLEGYLLAQVSATLAPDGTLVLMIDEGRLESVAVAGVHPDLAPDVQRLLGVTAGATLNVFELRHGIERVRARYPFLSPVEHRHRAQALLEIAETPAADGTVQYVPRAGRPSCDRDRDQGSFLGSGDDDDGRGRDCTFTDSTYQLDDHRLVVYLKADHADLDGSALELFRHTPVTGFAPGLLLTVRAFDPADRVHFRFDTLFNVNTSRSNVSARMTGTIGELAAAERIDFMVAPSLSVPRYGLTELGAAMYTLTDTDDAFRVSTLDSYLNSALFGRPERDYFRRTGTSLFATLHWFDALTLAGEYRHDRYDSLATASDPDTIFGDHIPVNPAITAGTAGSVLLRAEWSSDKTGIASVDAMRDRRPSQGSIVRRPSAYRATSCLRTVATLEVASPSLGGEMRFWRAASDSILSLATGDDQGVSMRVRVGGGNDLPLQREEALGGWGTLRGYDFKELGGGDLSALMNLEYRFDFISAFVDAGTIRAPGLEWQQARLGVGAALNLGDDGQLAFAWRTDDQAEARPQIRLLFGRTW